MKMLRKNIDSRGFFLFYLSCKTTVYRLQLNRLRHRFSSKYVSKTSLLKKNLWRKESMVYDHFNTIQDDPFCGCSRMAGAKKSLLPRPVTHILH